MHLKLNTSNLGKYLEFKRLFVKYGVELSASHQDIKEILSNPLDVVVHKASQMEEGVLVEDTQLEVEGAEIGIHVRWLLDHLPEFAGKRATWTVLLAQRNGRRVAVYRGVIKGMIVAPRGEGGFGFDPVFLPEEARHTLAEAKPDGVNARALAVDAFMSGEVFAECPLIEHWDGPWQNSH